MLQPGHLTHRDKGISVQLSGWEWVEQGMSVVCSRMFPKAPGGEETQGLGGRAHTWSLHSGAFVHAKCVQDPARHSLKCEEFSEDVPVIFQAAQETSGSQGDAEKFNWGFAV